MSDLLNNLHTYPSYILPLATLLVGLMGSFHCVGMCGPLVLAFNKTRTEAFLYQLGRLIGYLLVASLLMALGIGFQLQLKSELIVSAASFLLAGILIFYGMKILIHNRVHFEVPGWVGVMGNSLYQKANLVSNNSKPVLGFFSIFLPCGLLYGLLAMLLVSQEPYIVILSVLTFWLGTLPGMLFTPAIFHKLFQPLKAKAPLISAFTLIFMGLLTLAVRYQASLISHFC